MKKTLIAVLLALLPAFANAGTTFEAFASKGGIELEFKSQGLSSKKIKDGEFDWGYNPNRDLVNFDSGSVGDSDPIIDDAVVVGFQKSFESGFWTALSAGVYARTSFEAVDVTYHVSAFAMKQFEYEGESLMVELKANAFGAHAEKSAGHRTSVAGMVDVTRHIFPQEILQVLEEQDQEIEIWAGLSYTRNHNFDLESPDGLQFALRVKSSF